MGVDYSAGGGIGAKIDLPYTDASIEFLDELLKDTPYCYDMYGNSYSGEEFFMLLMEDPLSDGWDAVPEKVRVMETWLRHNGFSDKVEIISELYIW